MKATSLAPFLLTAICVLMPASPLLAAETTRLSLGISPQGPELRGDLSDPLWKGSPQIGGFVRLNSKEPARVPTEARVIATAEHLYVGFVCHEPVMDALVARVNEHDDAVWGDDCVEILVDPTGSGAHVYHWIVNSKGTLWDGFHAVGGGNAAAFDSTARVHTAKKADRWLVEVAIPLGEIGGGPQPGEVWGLNLGRERKAGEAEISSWVTTDSFSSPAGLGRMHFRAPAAPLVLEILSRGGIGEQFNDTGHNLFTVQAANSGTRPASVRLAVQVGGKPAGSTLAQIPAGGQAKLSAPYEVPPGKKGSVAFSVSAGDQVLYGSTLAVLAAQTRQPRTWVVERPLYKELLSGEPPKLARDGVLMWTHTLNARLMRETARRFAVRYVEDEAAADYGRHGLITVGGGPGQNPERFERHGIRYVAYLKSLPKEIPWELDPRAFDHYIGLVEALLKAPHPHLWGIYAGDELDEIAMSHGAKLMAAPPADYAYLKQADEEVRQQFGGGKWGIPQGADDKNPYRWIAYQRWALSRLFERHRRLRETVQRLDPSIHIVSTDPVGGVHGRQFSSQAPFFDVFTHQYLPRQSRWRQYLGFLTKVLVDLTGKEVWPCAHIENYAFATTPEEAVEELSQVFRNGGHGFHLYMPDCANGKKIVGDTRVTLFGSPRRYRTVMNTVDLIRQMPRPKYPEYRRTAILYNDDSLQSDYRSAARTHWYLTEACYTFLGPIAGSWFQFIDPEQIVGWPSLRERFDVIYLPTARYQRTEVVDKLTEFVKAGGTLVCGDPQAFATDLVGNDTSAARTALFGVEVGGTVKVAQLRARLKGKRYELPVLSGARALKPVGQVEVLGEFEEGSPAITRHKLGQGAAVLFAASPFQFKANENADWQRFFTAWTASLGAPVGLDIWRFRFPDSVIWREPPAEGYCLTGNHVLWQEETPRFPRNLDTGATYTYSLAPDGSADTAAVDVPVAEGKLTDRRASIHAEKTKPEWYAPYKLPAGRWLVTWKQAGPVTLTFDLKQPWKLQQVKLWVQDHLPEVTAEVSGDGQAWAAAGRTPALDAGEDVHDVALRLDAPAPARYLRLSFAQRPEGKKLTLIEAEVWGTHPE